MASPGNGAFAPNSAFTDRDFPDGFTNTLCFAEVKTYTPYNRDGGAGTTTIPLTPAEVEALALAGGSDRSSGHTEWPDGRVHQTGFTVTLGPNSEVSVNGGSEGDYTSCREDRICSGATFAAVTARSWHDGMVHGLLMDGSARPFKENIDLGLWRLLGQRNDGEPTVEF